MDILFSGNGLEKICSEGRTAKKKLGGPCAKKLQARLADLVAAECVGDLVAGNPHPLEGDRKGQFSLSLQGGRRLVFEPADDPIPADDNGNIAWAEVTSVLIVFIGDYHG